jgi:hypothetical protein
LSYQLFHMITAIQGGANTGLASMTASSFSISAALGGSVAMWVFAMPISRFVTRGVSEDVTLGTLTLRDCYSFGFVIVGLFFIVGGFAEAVSSTYSYLTRGSLVQQFPSEPMMRSQMFNAYLRCLLGYILLSGGRKWSRRLATKHLDDPAEQHGS